MKFSLIAAFAIALAVSFTGCTDPCKDVVCVNGECVEGDCVCDTGYEGTDCSEKLNAKFAASYNLSEVCTSGSDGYVVDAVGSSTNASNIVFTGLYAEPAVSVTAVVTATSTSSFTIERQGFGTFSLNIEGSGAIDAAGNITVSYKILDSADNSELDNCVATLTRI